MTNEEDKCIFFSREVNDCRAREIVAGWDDTNTPVRELTEEYKRVICQQKWWRTCMRRVVLVQIIETGAWGS